MRSWVGVVQMTADPLGLPSLVRLLADPHVSTPTQKAVMETLSDLLEPVVAQAGEDDGDQEDFATMQNRGMWLPSAGRDATKQGLADPVYNLLDNYARSEEHTSELQSLMRISYAVFCLKKKNRQNTTIQQK